MERTLRRAAVFAAAALLCDNSAALAHGFAGDRFFPATILTDDPFVASEASLPTVTLNPTASDETRELDLDVDLALLITPRWGFTFSNGWTHLKTPGTPSQ
jgi:hypothetical protein